MINAEGIKAFRGTMLITPKASDRAPFELTGDWVYKPDTGCWYSHGRSFPSTICLIIHDETEATYDPLP